MYLTMDDVFTLPFDIGINNDRYEVWRNADDIGYVQLAFKIITEAMYDLVLGDIDDHESACFFFFGNPEASTYKLWARVLGIDENTLPPIVEKFRRGQVSQRDIENIRNLCTTMKTI